MSSSPPPPSLPPTTDESFEQFLAHQQLSADLVKSAFLERIELKQRIEELSRELEVWKGGHKDAVKQRSVLAKELKELNGADPIVLCLLDGDGCIFSRHFVSQGKEGGKEVAQKLLTQITEKAKEEINDGRNVQVVCIAFHNRFGLGKVLNELGIATMETYNQFVLGFNSSHPLFTLTDVGATKESADSKIRSTLRLYAKIPSCKLIFAGCSHDAGYVPLFNSLSTEGLVKEKIKLLKGYDEVPYDLRQLNLRTVAMDGIFEPKKLKVGGNGSGGNNHYSKDHSNTVPGAARSASPTKKGGKSSNGAASAGDGSSEERHLTRKEKRALEKQAYKEEKAGYSYREERAGESGKESGNEFVKVGGKKPFVKKIDPKKALSKQAHPPCNAFYLHPMKCPRNEECRYSHEYKLEPKYLELLRKDARKSPCLDLLKGRECSLGDQCYSGHTCPWGSKCRYGSECRFTSPGMHPDVSDWEEPSDDGSYPEFDFQKMGQTEPKW